MKKLLLLSLVFFFGAQVFAQKNNSGQSADDPFRATKSNFTLEVGFIPFNVVPISLSQLKLRFFANDKLAIRLGANLSSTSKSATAGTVAQKSSCFVLGIYPGIEYHVGNLKRLSPYFGAEANIYFKWYNYVEKTDNKETKVISGQWDVGSSRCGFTDVGLNLLAGVDFYFSKHIYMGVEFYYGFVMRFNHKIVQTIPEPEVVLTDKSSSFNLVGDAIPSIRLGWAF